MVSAEWGTRNGLTSKFAGPKPHGELMGRLCSVYADGKQYIHITESRHYIFLGIYRGIHTGETCWQHV